VDDVASDVDHVASAIAARERISEALNELVETLNQANQTYGHREEAILQAATHDSF
jgi:hypothetical protein